MPRQVRALRLVRQAHADVLDVFLQLLVPVHAHLLSHFRIQLPASADLLLLAHERDLTLSGERIAGASRDENRKKNGETWAQKFHSVLLDGRSAVLIMRFCNQRTTENFSSAASRGCSSDSVFCGQNLSQTVNPLARSNRTQMRAFWCNLGQALRRAGVL